MLITLQEWAKQNYSKPPHRNTLYNWAKYGNIQPPPQKHGRTYYVKPTAKYFKA